MSLTLRIQLISGWEPLQSKGETPSVCCWADGSDLALIDCCQVWESVRWLGSTAFGPAAGLPPLPGWGTCAALSALSVGRFNSAGGCVSYSGLGVCEVLSRLFSVWVPCHCSSQVGQGGGTSFWKCSGDKFLPAVHHEAPSYARCGHAMTMRLLRDKIRKTVLWDSVAFVPNCNVLLW